jgi:hypothetical protein
MPSEPVDQKRVDLLRAAGISVSEADAERVSLSVRASLAALQAAVSGSLFDTEPQTFDVTLRKLSKGGDHD